ncbi:cysteine hydrolase family protein [Lapidilactobacillus wuchangensis]|uniref:cysteine hydrolase family protein n=1 Tax=Lapidilactobacillus wuchangensis TaxID=2486001 RepID=UPI000F794777|nr:isochorismatase family cysteine hydrolase [Lapidilactobacillus wuchangensis]
MRGLVVIDYTNDFVASDGALTTGEPGQKIAPALLQVTKDFVARQDFVVMAVDGHDPADQYHPENKLFPPHNVIGTTGRHLYGELATYYQQNQDQFYWLDKRHYSAFCGTDLDLRLRERRITELHLVGVCTDICVLHTAVDAYNLGYDIVIHQDAVASFDPVGHEWALRHFQNTLGATLV